MKFALLSVTYSGQFYRGSHLTLEEQIRRARELGFDGLSIETKRPIASPLDLDRSARRRIREIADGEGVALCAVESLSNFAGRRMEDRENNLMMMRETIRMAVDLGVDLVKVFAAWPGVVNDEEEIAMYAPYETGQHFKRPYPADLRRWHRAVEGLRETADFAADHGVTLALQNHAPVIAPGYEDVLAMVQQVDRPNVKLCLDVPWFRERQSDEYVREAVAQCGDLIVLTHYGAWNFSESPDGEPIPEVSPAFGGFINYETFVAELLRVGYDGYLVSEYCLPVVRNHELHGIEEVDRANELALRYMKSLVGEALTAA